MNKTATGVLLVNLGTPEAPTPGAVRAFLRDFLSDPRVVEIPRLIWLCILYGVILPFRPRKVAHAYASIWTEQGSPLRVLTESLAHRLQARLTEASGDAAPKVAVAYTYGEPSIACQLSALREAGVERTLVLPLYPQYSATTTGSVYDQCAAVMKASRDIPDLVVQKHYYSRPDYVRALVNSIRSHRAQHPGADCLLFSFHGIPRRNVDLGDPYEQHCLHTARDVATILGLEEHQWRVSFQSRLGRAEWLKPYTDETLRTLPSEGVKRLDVICPAFAIDCLETLEEIDVENREVFLESGGADYQYIPCLNDSEDQVFFLANLVAERLG